MKKITTQNLVLFESVLCETLIVYFKLSEFAKKIVNILIFNEK